VSAENVVFMESFTPVASTLGGLLIGVSASLLLVLNGRVAGVSGIVAGIFSPRPGEVAWRVAFIAGLLAGGVATFFAAPELFAITYDRTLPVLAVAGLLVGLGVRLGGGCTSGHGVCGLSRLSPRSLVATLTFITAGAITVYLWRVLAGGGG
jgi:hypothetical protein